MKFVVTGGAGFIGSFLVEKLLEENHQVVIVDQIYSNRFAGDVRVGWRVADISSPNLVGVLAGADGVFHLAAYAQIDDCIKNPARAEEINIGGTLNILQSAKQAMIPKVVYVSSASIYGQNPNVPWKESEPIEKFLNPYAFTKYLGEALCRQFSALYGLRTASLRLFNVFGSLSAISGTGRCPGVVEIFLRQRKNDQPLTIVGNGGRRRDLVYVGDVARAAIATMLSDKTESGEVINIGSGRSHSVAEIAKFVGGPTISVPDRYLEPFEMFGDITIARQLLGWEPQTSLESWIMEAKNFYQLAD